MNPVGERKYKNPFGNSFVAMSSRATPQEVGRSFYKIMFEKLGLKVNIHGLTTFSIPLYNTYTIRWWRNIGIKLLWALIKRIAVKK